MTLFKVAKGFVAVDKVKCFGVCFKKKKRKEKENDRSVPTSQATGQSGCECEFALQR